MVTYKAYSSLPHIQVNSAVGADGTCVMWPTLVMGGVKGERKP